MKPQLLSAFLLTILALITAIFGIKPMLIVAISVLCILLVSVFCILFAMCWFEVKYEDLKKQLGYED